MSTRSKMATFITFNIVLVISWIAWGHSTEHIWSTWLLTFGLLVGLILHGSMLYDRISAETFDKIFLFNIIAIVIFTLFFLGSIGAIAIQAFSILGYIISGAFGILLIYAVVRYFLKQASE